jgi:hypothetical protein
MTTVNRNVPSIVTNANLSPLTDDDLKRAVPAVFSKKAHPEVTPRYGFIDSGDLVSALRESGFVPVEARSYHRRNADVRRYSKHMLKFRHAGSLEKLTQVGEVVPQVMFINSHDRSSRFQMFGGLFRLVCSNGLIVSAGSAVEPVRLRHTINMVDEAVLQALSLIEQSAEITEVIDDMRKLKMTKAQQEKFALDAFTMGRFGRAESESTPDVMTLLAARRPADEGDDLWHVFNRVQENVTKGGAVLHTAANRRVTLPGISSIDGDMRFNTTAWTLAMDVLGRVALSSKAAAEGKAEIELTEEDLV